MDNYLAFDLGAGSGRAIVGSLDDSGRLQIKELYRFPNPMIKQGGNLHWDIKSLYQEITRALCLYSTQGPLELISIGVDAWGCDFGLLDESGNLLDNPFTYRNPATTSDMESFLEKIPRERLYYLTGIQLMIPNSVFQLHSLVNQNNPVLSKAKDLLFIPDLFNYFLTGRKMSEFTVATTSQLYNPRSDSWDKEIINKVGISANLMQQIIQPGTIIGNTSAEVTKASGLKTVPVAVVASHDTGSAVVAVPVPDDDFCYISCGTWSLMGILSDKPIINEKTFKRCRRKISYRFKYILSINRFSCSSMARNCL